MTLIHCVIFITCAVAHMEMAKPVPFNTASLDNSPIAADGSNFPCKIGGSYGYTVSTMNTIPAGVPQPLEFKGSAIHGGGSCQISISTDKKPTKSSSWKVIKTFIGGCPTPGDQSSNFNFTVPKVVPNGEMTLAWSWINHIGNREFYMNCAPITITGGASNANGMNSLPDMFVANIGTTTCKTPDEGTDPDIPNPGNDVERRGAGPFSSNLPGCNAPAGSVPKGGENTPSQSSIPAAVPSASASPAIPPYNNGQYTPWSAPLNEPTTSPLSIHIGMPPLPSQFSKPTVSSASSLNLSSALLAFSTISTAVALVTTSLPGVVTVTFTQLVSLPASATSSAVLSSSSIYSNKTVSPTNRTPSETLSQSSASHKRRRLFKA